MSEVLNNELMETEEMEVYDLTEEETGNGSGAVKAVVGVVLAVGAAAGLAYKFRHKIKEARTAAKIKKLENDGYVVFKTDEVEVVEDVTDDESEKTE